jgi:hypothetical protein
VQFGNHDGDSGSSSVALMVFVGNPKVLFGRFVPIDRDLKYFLLTNRKKEKDNWVVVNLRQKSIITIIIIWRKRWR